MEDARGERNVIAETRKRMNSFRLFEKLRGFDGSSCESQPTRPSSSSVNGYFSAGRSSFLVDLRDKCFSSSAPISSSLFDSSRFCCAV